MIHKITRGCSSFHSFVQNTKINTGMDRNAVFTNNNSESKKDSPNRLMIGSFSTKMDKAGIIEKIHKNWTQTDILFLAAFRSSLVTARMAFC